MDLFACSKCFKRYPFEELSSGKQLCKKCEGPPKPAKCQFCKQEFIPQSKLTEKPTCKVCDAKIVKYGPPKPCTVCNLIAAFGNHNCMRCFHYEKKYGPPRQCEQCKQMSAYIKPEEKAMLKGRQLCWICAAPYKKAMRKSSDHSRKRKLSGRGEKRSDRLTRDVFDDDSSRGSLSLSSSANATSSPAKLGRGLKSSDETDPSSSDHFATIAQMREEITNMKKQMATKDQQLLTKDKLVNELRAQIHNIEAQYRQKTKMMQKTHEEEMTELRSVTKDLQMKVASLTKLTKGGKNSNNLSNSTPSSHSNSPNP